MSAQLPYNIRNFNLNSPSDIERMNLMYFHPQVMKDKGYFVPGFDYKKVGSLSEADHSLKKVTAKVGKRSRDITYVVVDQKNELVGWVWFYVDKKYILPKSVAKLLKLNSRNSKVYQVSYQKLLSVGWPKRLLQKVKHTSVKTLSQPRRGVIVHGLKQAMSRLQREHKEVHAEKRLIVYGFVNPANIASSSVLVYNGFVKHTKQYKYDGILNDLYMKVLG